MLSALQGDTDKLVVCASDLEFCGEPTLAILLLCEVISCLQVSLALMGKRWLYVFGRKSC